MNLCESLQTRLALLAGLRLVARATFLWPAKPGGARSGHRIRRAAGDAFCAAVACCRERVAHGLLADGRRAFDPLRMCCMIEASQPLPHYEVRSQAEHRIRSAASLARPGWIWAAAVIMNAPSVAGAALLAWFAFTADGPALTTVAGLLFALALFWAFTATAGSWQVLRRFARRFSR